MNDITHTSDDVTWTLEEHSEPAAQDTVAAAPVVPVASPTSPTKHRHWIAVPAFALVLGIIFVLGRGGEFVSSTLHPAAFEQMGSSAEDRIVNFPNSSVYARVFRGADFEFWNNRAVLRKGSILVASPGMAEVYVDRSIIKGIDGAFHVNMKGDIVTVSALTTAVSVRIGQSMLVVPSGYLWKSGSSLADRSDGWDKWLHDRKPRKIPGSFSKSMIKFADELLSVGEGAAQPQSVSAAPQKHFWQFAAAHDRAMDRWAAQVQEAVSAAVTHNDRASLEQVLESQDALFALPNASSLAASLMAGKSLPMQKAQVLPLLQSDPDLFVALSLHPTLRSAAWAQGAPDLEDDEALVRLASFPFADNTQESASNLLVHQWQEEFLIELSRMNDAGAFLSVYLPSLAALAQEYAAQGYPERAIHYLSSALVFGAARRDALSEATRGLLDALAAQDLSAVVSQRVQPLQEKPAAPVARADHAPVPPSAKEAEALINQVREALRQAGAVFSVQTGFDAISKTRIKVTGIIFSNGKVDRSLNFTWDLEKDEVRNISTGGKTLPFPLTFEQLVAWAKAE